MKKLIILLFLLPLVFFSQEEFSFELYFEDALGNKDTLVLGYDPLATDSIDVAFGEVNILNQPWNSVFEVRAGDDIIWYLPGEISQTPSYQSKKQIIDKSCDFDYDITINIRAENYPFKIYWDTTLFTNDSCRLASVLTGTPQFQTDVFEAPEAFLSNRYHGIGTGFSDTLIIDSTLLNDKMRFYVDGTSNIVVMWLSFANPINFNPNNIIEISKPKSQVFPNPTNSILNIEVSDEFLGGELKIYDILGNQVWIETIKSNRFTIDNFANLSEGVYTILFSKDGYFETQKVVKQ